MNYLGDNSRPDRLTNQQLIKADNIKRVFDLINGSANMSRAELTRLTRLSPTTVSALVDELLAAQLVVETGTKPMGQSGRRPVRLAINGRGAQIVVFSLGRRGVSYTLYNLQYEQLEAHFLPHASDQYGGFDEDALDDSPEAGEVYARLFEEVLARHAPRYRPDSVAAVCVSFPGIYLSERDAFSLSSMHVSLSRASMEAFEARSGAPLFFANNSMCHAYAEKKWLDRHGEAIRDLLYVNVCEGVGAGLVLHGEMFTGFGSTAGEIGHIAIERGGLKCNCGSRGCLERYVNTDRVVERVLAATGAGAAPTLAEIGAAYEAGDPAVSAVIDEVAGELFTGIHAAVCVTGIKSIVLGGGIEQLGERFRHRLSSFTQGPSYRPILRDMRILYTRAGPKSDSLGAAQYFIDKVFLMG